MLNGEVSRKKEKYSINIKGNLFKSIGSDEKLIGDIVDTTNNFEFVFCSIIKNPNSKDLKINPNLENQETLQLFLLRKNTREFFMFEVPLNTSVLNYDKAKKLDNITKEHWWVNVFEPIEEITNESGTKDGRDYEIETFSHKFYLDEGGEGYYEENNI